MAARAPDTSVLEDDLAPSMPEAGTQTRYAERALDALRASGLRITRPRRSVVELLERASGSSTAAAIHEALKKRRIAIDLASVYRTLAVLESRGLIHRLATVEGVVRCEPGFEESACHHHLVCVRCGTVREMACDGQLALRARVLRETGFAADAHKVELTGVCAPCQAGVRPVADA
jgi:Fur family ferric uptake transcriptional regulator